MRPSTFSIVAHDPDAQEWGVAVASKFLAVGSLVPWCRAGAGAVATQSYANSTFGPLGLELMARGYSAQSALDGLLAADEGRAQRQVGLVDGVGRAATFTGDECYSWAGGRSGPHYAAQGNILAGPEVVEHMAESFEGGAGILADRLLAALGAGQDAGGDSRGQQSAALLVVRSGAGYGGFNDRYIDLRVDDHPTPIGELRRLLDLHRLYMFETRPEDVLPITQERARAIQQVLLASGHRQAPPTGGYDQDTQRAFRILCGTENLEGRWREGPEVDRVVLDYLAGRYLSP
ncbi:MAG: DUF1028 domain-containing protein [Chloroflexi bacterium]|nr:DUF1028 domain-containing protein [Chloroflexota bacterium]